MVSDIVIGSAIRSTVLSINRTQNVIDQTTLRLATGRSVNSALDQPSNFFAAQSLQNRAGDFDRLLDGIGQSIRTLEETDNGITALDQLLDQADAVARTSQEFIEAGETDPAVTTRVVEVSPQPLSSQILAASPDVYFRLNETGGAIVDSGFGAAGPVSATRTGGATANAAPLYDNGAAPSVNFDGINDRISVSDSTLINLSPTAERTIELVFNADTTAGRQVIYEEGAGVNGLTIYIDNGLLRVTGEDDQGSQRFADLDISVPITAGETNHVALVFDGPNATFAGFLNGTDFGTLSINTEGTFPSHSGDIGIGGVSGGVQFHDGETNAAAGFNFNGRISDVAIYNRALTDAELFLHAESLNSATTTQFVNEDFAAVIDQVERVAIDASYRGISLLAGDTLTTRFNETGTSTLETEGFNFAERARAIPDFDFNTVESIQALRDQVQLLQTELREFSTTVSNDISIIQAREDFTIDLINTHLAAADDLTLADQNEEGANLLAAQTRLALGQTALSFGVQQSQQILTLFS